MQKTDTPKNVARVLWTASPGGALGFARAEQEKACWEFGGDRAEFWDQVLSAIEELGQFVYRPGEATGVPVAARHTMAAPPGRPLSRSRASASRQHRLSEAGFSDSAL